jgi:hypothetical protein
MQPSELRRKVGVILTEEDRPEANWERIARLSEELDAELRAQDYADCPEVVRHFLCDNDIRARDAAYARRQTEHVRAYVEAGEYHDSQPLPWWSCLPLLAILTGAMIWLVLG